MITFYKVYVYNTNIDDILRLVDPAAFLSSLLIETGRLDIQTRDLLYNPKYEYKKGQLRPILAKLLESIFMVTLS